MDERAQWIGERLREVRERITRACDAAGRAPHEVTLIAITKTHPVADVERLLDLGVSDIGENRDQEARPKIEAARATGRLLRAHFVGQLQTNKAASVAQYADVVHSVDRARLVAALDRGALAAGRRLGVLVEVGLADGTPTGAQPSAAERGGVAIADVLQLAALVADSAALDLRGVMGIAPLDGDPLAAFTRLADIAAQVRARYPAATWISAGMSGDLEAAIACGATHVRVGTAILGSREPLR